MKSQTFRDFFAHFKEQSVCLICGRALYIRKMSIVDAIHLEKACYKHNFNLSARSATIDKQILTFDREGLLESISKPLLMFDPHLNIHDSTIIHNEASFAAFIQNWKILA